MLLAECTVAAHMAALQAYWRRTSDSKDPTQSDSLLQMYVHHAPDNLLRS